MSVRRRISALWRRASGADARAAARSLAHQRAQGIAPFPSLAPDSAFTNGNWSLIGGDGAGWPRDEFYKVRGFAWHEKRLYTSLSGPATDGPRGEVWAWDERGWEQVSGGWRERESFVEHLAAWRGNLYAAERGGVWRRRAGVWDNVGRDLAVPGKAGGYAFGEWRERLAMTFWGEPGVALYDGERWERLPAPAGGWGEGARTVYCAQEFGGLLYAGTGTGKFSGPGACIWRFDGRAWEKIAGQGVRGSWIDMGIPFVLSLNLFGGMLIATVSRTAGTHPLTSNVWAFDGERWRAIGNGKVPAAMARSAIMNDTAVFGGRLVAATGDGSHREAQMWELDVDQSWRAVGDGRFTAPASAEGGGYWIYRLCAAGDALFAGTAGHRGAARVFRFGR